MTKIAVLSDVHGDINNFHRIAEAAAAMDIIIFLGDLFTGGDNPEDCWKGLEHLNPDCWILGNTDEWLLDCCDGKSLNDECRKEMETAKAQLSVSVIDMLGSMDRQRQLKVGQVTIFCIHDYPELRTGDLTTVEKVLNAGEHDLVLFGHTHKQLLVRSGSHIAVNPGAVCEGQYAVIDITDTVKSISLLSL